ncbi:MAG TPA: class I SAM-dependent methyltransferase [Candidatus Bathyarchaeia archaeon]|nr:class I SAM-dependent methyltransferase [Candidatus Bathyarchaeia archaeon]
MFATNENFYIKQSLWSPEIYFGKLDGTTKKKISIIKKYIPKGKNILDLGAGGGQISLAMADLGYNVVGIELLPGLADYARKNGEKSQGRLNIVEGDFYKFNPKKKFNLITYWDGFGIGDDNDQRTLLHRIKKWLSPDGMALIEVYTPWYPGYFSKKEMKFSGIKRKLDFDFENCRWEDTWTKENGHKSIKQSLRCYSPADLRLLLGGTGLAIKKIIPCVGFDKGEILLYGKKSLANAITYLALLEKE